MMKYDDEQLIAYCLGDCPPDLKSEIDQALAQDPSLQEQLAFVKQLVVGVKAAPSHRPISALGFGLRLSLVAAVAIISIGIGVLLQAKLNLIDEHQAVKAEQVDSSNPFTWDSPILNIL